MTQATAETAGASSSLRVGDGVTDPVMTAGASLALPRVAVDRRIPPAKRLLDCVVAALGLVFLAPLLVVIAALVRLTSPGPVLYRQQRYGLGGRPFEMLKFRTMCDDAEQRLDELLDDEACRDQLATRGKIEDDPRVTAVGRVLRFLSLDELPQLVNVLRGEMSLVGPRPRWGRFELRGYGSALDEYLSVAPGLTGPWQVSGRNNLTDDQRVALDLHYARGRTLPWDVALLIRTIPVLLWPFGRGAA